MQSVLVWRNETVGPLIWAETVSTLKLPDFLCCKKKIPNTHLLLWQITGRLAYCRASLNLWIGCLSYICPSYCYSFSPHLNLQWYCINIEIMTKPEGTIIKSMLSSHYFMYCFERFFSYRMSTQVSLRLCAQFLPLWIFSPQHTTWFWTCK